MNNVQWIEERTTVGAVDSLEWVGYPGQSFEMVHDGVRVVFPGPRVSSLGQPEEPSTSNWSTFWTVLGITGAALAAYHGYKRDNSVGWAAGWGLLGYLFPYITVPVALAQGYAKPAK